ncbi:hypothetical protein C0J52_20431, partial [Blattella germanica]
TILFPTTFIATFVTCSARPSIRRLSFHFFLFHFFRGTDAHTGTGTSSGTGTDSAVNNISQYSFLLRMANKGRYGKWSADELHLAVTAYLNGDHGLNECALAFIMFQNQL